MIALLRLILLFLLIFPTHLFAEGNQELIAREKIFVEKYDKSTGLDQKWTFYDNEYGKLYWESKEDLLYNWRFKTNKKFKSIQIVMTIRDKNQKILQKVLVDDDSFHGPSPLEFIFGTGNPQPMGSSDSSHLSIPFEFSTTTSSQLSGGPDWAVLDENQFKDAEPNKEKSLTDSFDKSVGEIGLVSYKTLDGGQEHTAIIVIRYETQ